MKMKTKTLMMKKNTKILQKNKHIWDFLKESESLRISEDFL